jgi:TIR domain
MFKRPEDFSIVLQRVGAGGLSGQCQGFVSVAIPTAARFAVVSDDYPPIKAAADDLHACLETKFTSMAQADQVCTGPGLLDCWATNGTATNLLVVVAGRNPASPWLTQTVDDWRNQGMATVGVVHRADDPRTVLPAVMRDEVALIWDSTSCELADEVIELGLLSQDDRRVFISYAHVDGRAPAEQLFTELSKKRFDVFLDRFRTAPGADFVRRIEDELIDKAMIVVVETPAALLSPWVIHEIQTAVTKRLGLAAIMPGSGSGFASIPEAFRYRLTGAAAIDPVALTFIVERHRSALLNNRLTLTRSLEREFSDPAVASIRVLGSGCQVTSMSSGTQFEIGTSPRPVGLPLARRTAGRARGPGQRSVVIHPIAPSPERRADISWVLSNANTIEVDEAQLATFAQQVRSGAL